MRGHGHRSAPMTGCPAGHQEIGLFASHQLRQRAQGHQALREFGIHQGRTDDQLLRYPSTYSPCHELRLHETAFAASELVRPEGVANAEIITLEALLEPADALLGTAMRERVGHDVTLPALLQSVITNCGSSIQT